MGIKVECVEWLGKKCVRWKEIENGKIAADLRMCDLETQRQAQEFGTRISRDGLRLEIGKLDEPKKKLKSG